jgi:hypothetical protein
VSTAQQYINRITENTAMELHEYEFEEEILDYDGDYVLSVEYEGAYMLMNHSVLSARQK